jgi:endonuclease/exonuclease/phosphatase family metal-dependent hydrolase
MPDYRWNPVYRPYVSAKLKGAFSFHGPRSILMAMNQWEAPLTDTAPLPPITRRQFLGSLVAGAFYLSAPQVRHFSTTALFEETRQQAAPQRLRVLTLNVWGIPIAQDRAERMKAIGEQITALDPDIVALQEAFMPEDRDRILAYLAPGKWPYSHYFTSGIVGSGVMIISRYPVVDATFHRYRLGGRPERVWEADYYAGKGIGLVRLTTPAGLLDVYATHALAQYSPDTSDEYAAHRATNMYEAARFVVAQSAGNPVLLCGDLNTRPDQPGYRLVTVLGGLIDCFAQANPGDPGITYSPTNPYADNEPAQRIDYIFARHGTNLGFNIRTVKVALNDKPAGNARAYSDHYGVLAELELTPTPDVAAPRIEPHDVKQALDELAVSLGKALDDARGRQSVQTAQAGIGLASIPVANIGGRWLQRRWRVPGSLLRQVGTPLAAAYTALNGALLLFSLPDEIQSLHELSAEVAWQINARRAFNGISW